MLILWRIQRNILTMERTYEKYGEQALINSKLCPFNLTIHVPEETEKLINYYGKHKKKRHTFQKWKYA